MGGGGGGGGGVCMWEGGGRGGCEACGPSLVIHSLTLEVPAGSALLDQRRQRREVVPAAAGGGGAGGGAPGRQAAAGKRLAGRTAKWWAVQGRAQAQAPSHEAPLFPCMPAAGASSAAAAAAHPAKDSPVKKSGWLGRALPTAKKVSMKPTSVLPTSSKLVLRSPATVE